MNTNRSLMKIRGVEVLLLRKKIKNLHLNVLPPNGTVRVSVPFGMSDDAIHTFLATRLSWIKKQQAKFKGQERQTPRKYVSGESHYFLGKRYRLEVVYINLFKDSLSKAFPDGNNEARTFLERLVDPRNALSHAHPISNRKAEQVVCYCHDIIDSIKEYYFKMGTEHEFNVPSIIKITEYFGNSIHSHEIKERSPFIWELDDDRKNYLFPGDNLGIEIEIDPSFEPSSYTIEWIIKNEYIEKYNNKTRISFKLGVKHVGELCIVKCKIISNKNWHKHNTYDDKISIFYKVLPPLNDH